MALCTFTLFCSHHHYPSLELFVKLKLCPCWILAPGSPLPQTPTVPLSVSVNLASLGTSCKWNRPGLVLLWLAYFTERNVLQFHPCCPLWQDFPLFKGWILFNCMHRSNSLYPFILAILNNMINGASLNILFPRNAAFIHSYLEPYLFSGVNYLCSWERW